MTRNIPSLLLGMVLVSAGAAYGDEAQDQRLRFLVSALDRPVPELDKGEIALPILLDFLGKAVDKPDAVIITVDVATFKRETQGMFDPERVSIQFSTKLINARLDSILGIVAEQAGAVVMVRKDYIELVPREFACKELGIKLTEDQLMPPLVHRFFTKMPLDKALQQMAERYNQNIVLAPAVEYKKETLISARLVNVPFDAAVEALAEMADLRVVRKANVFCVTTKEHAEELLAEQKRKEQLKQNMSPDVKDEPKK